MKRLLPFLLIFFVCSQAEAKIFIKPFDATGAANSSDITIPCSANKILKSTGIGTWACADDATAGAPTFDQIGSGLNVTATMIVGSGGTLKPAGTAEITSTSGDSATSFFTSGVLEPTIGGTGRTVASDDTVLIGDDVGWQGKTVPSCTDSGGNHLNYNQATNAFSCGTSSSTTVTTPTGTGFVHINAGVQDAASRSVNLASSDITGVLAEANGGTNQSTYDQGDLLYASAANTLSKLAKNTSATTYLANTGASNKPSWDQVNVANGVIGTLPVANGGTGATSLTDLIALGTQTTGNYVANVATTSPLTGGSAGSESASLTISIPAANATTNGYMPSQSMASIDTLVAVSHAAVTVTGQNYLSLSGQQITANAVDLGGNNVTGYLNFARHPALTGDVTTVSGALATTIATAAVSGDKVATQGVSTDKLEAMNKPTDGQLLGYNATALKGKWFSLSAIETDPVVKAINGIVKSDTSTISAAVEGTDYYKPGGTDVAVADGGTNKSSVSNDAVLVGNNAGTGYDQPALPNCTDTAGNHLNYTAGQNAFSCGTSASVSANTGTGFVHVNAGVQDIASRAVNLASADVTGTLAETNGGTNQSTYTQGDILYASAANTLSKLAKNASATTYLANTAASNNPSWDQINVTNGIKGAVPVANGGTALTSVSNDAVFVGNNAGTGFDAPAIPNCTDSGGQHLNYTAGQNAFSCGTTDLNAGDITAVYDVASGAVTAVTMTTGQTFYAGSGKIRMSEGTIAMSQNGEFKLKTSADAIIVQAGSAATGGIGASQDVAIPLLEQKDITIIEPDQAHTVSQDVVFFTVDGLNYPNGIKIVQRKLTLSSSTTVDYSLVKKTDMVGGTVTSIDAMKISSNTESMDGSITAGDVASGDIVFVDLDATNIDSAHVTVWYYAKD